MFNKQLLVGYNIRDIYNCILFKYINSKTYGIRAFDINNEHNISVMGNADILLNVYTCNDVIFAVGKFSFSTSVSDEEEIEFKYHVNIM